MKNIWDDKMGHENNQIMSFVILGGGTAGWMCAIYLQSKWKTQNIKISLVESPDIGIVGVGEGSTPSLKNFFDDVGIEESEWMQECNATYKVGIRFDGWSGVAGCESYRHPFPNQLDGYSSQGFTQYCHLRRSSFDVNAHPDPFFLQSYLAEKNLFPLPAHSFPFTSYYGYHFDSGLLGKFLAKKALERGVKHIQEKVVDVEQDQQGNIQTLKFENGGSIDGDFFIDCSGFVG
ncbi:MAG: tryptophan 7-halogenase, partial [Kangiellaceae bacterium]|nr:tryptophan 7-halogenase [Kangiellaceae bacterium]